MSVISRILRRRYKKLFCLAKKIFANGEICFMHNPSRTVLPRPETACRLGKRPDFKGIDEGREGIAP